MADKPMIETPVEVLERWERHGASWKVHHLSDALAIVDLCTCYGEPVDRLETDDADAIRYLRDRGTSAGTP
jgi:hypothetical protein